MAGSYADPTTLWDLSQASSFSQLPDDDFLALLQKQFPSTVVPLPPVSTTNSMANPSVNPLSLGDSDGGDTSPTTAGGTKRKAADTDEDEAEGPSSKTSKKSGAASGTKRKSTGSGGADDNRLLKRKEQNRAAQRAFRERKEKHVKELEDKVTALESKNEEASTENQNLRDLLSRLQNENMMLKQQQFTFQMKNSSSSQSQQQQQQQALSPPAAGNSPASSSASPSSASGSSTAPVQTPFTSSPMFSMPTTSASPFSTPTPPFPTDSMDPLEYSSYANLDPNAFSLFDDFFSQDTASSKAMDLDIGGFGKPAEDRPFELISVASNPLFTTFPSLFDMTPSKDSPQAPHNSDTNVLPDFDLNSLTSSSPNSWGGLSQVPQSQPPLSGTLDDLFGLPTNMASQTDFSSFLPQAQQANVSPVVHSSVPSGIASASSPSSPSSHGSGPSLFSASSNHASPASDMSDHNMGDENSKGKHGGDQCPKTRPEYEQRLAADGMSMFSPSQPDTNMFSYADSMFSSAPPSKPTESQPLQPLSGGENIPMPMINCENGTSLPKTQQSDKNIELLTAWKSIRTDPQYKDIDINSLCSEFSAKAKCDGTKACDAKDLQFMKVAADVNGGVLPNPPPSPSKAEVAAKHYGNESGGIFNLYRTETADGRMMLSAREMDREKIAISTPHPGSFHASGYLL